MTNRALEYTYSVDWSDEDAGFVATVAEFPSMSFLAESHIRALAGLRRVVREVVADMQANGESVPTGRGIARSNLVIRERVLESV